jgi:predicted nucleic acid-binding protein
MTRLLVLDNEAVQALRDPAHSKHLQVVSLMQVVAGRKARALTIEVVVPTTVRVEEGWDRTSPARTLANRLRVSDIPLDAANASTAATIRIRTKVSVADAHLGAVFQTAGAADLSVVTSDVADMHRVAGAADITVIAI